MSDFVSIQFDKNDGPLYRALADALAGVIDGPAEACGQRLPPVRELAEKLGVNTSTVVAAYRSLEEQGLVYTKPGSGTYCLPPTRPVTEADETDMLFNEYADISSGRLAISDDMINLAGNSPTAGVFPVADFKSAVNEVLDTDGGFAFSYQESEGYRPLREILARFSGENYGIACGPETVLITSGSQQALDIITKALLHSGDTVLAEMPSYIGMHSVFTMRGAKILGVPMEPDGVNLDITEYYAKRYSPRLMYVMPVYQTPTGACMSALKRQKLLELAERHHFYIIEDDLFSDINLAGPRLLPLKKDDRADRVIYVKSFSKLLMPGIRTGYVIAPQKLFERLEAAKYATDISGSGFIQRALAVYFKNGCWGGNIERLTATYSDRMKAAVKAISGWKQCGVRFSEVRGGFGIWVTLPAGVTDREIYFRCKEKQVLVAPGSSFYISPAAGYEQHLRLSFASTDRLENGLEIAGECIKAAVSRSSKHTIFI